MNMLLLCSSVLVEELSCSIIHVPPFPWQDQMKEESICGCWSVSWELGPDEAWISASRFLHSRDPPFQTFMKWRGDFEFGGGDKGTGKRGGGGGKGGKWSIFQGVCFLHSSCFIFLLCSSPCLLLCRWSSKGKPWWWWWWPPTTSHPGASRECCRSRCYTASLSTVPAFNGVQCPYTSLLHKSAAYWNHRWNVASQCSCGYICCCSQSGEVNKHVKSLSLKYESMIKCLHHRRW